MTDLLSSPQLILDEQHASESFCMFECAPLKKAADVNKIFIHHKDIQFDITTFHFKNQLDSSKKPLKAKPGNAERPLPVNTIIGCIAKIMSPQMCHIFAWEIKPICGNGGLGLREHRVACKDEWYLAQHEENERCAAWCLAQMKALISGAKIKMTERQRLQLGLCYW